MERTPLRRVAFVNVEAQTAALAGMTSRESEEVDVDVLVVSAESEERTAGVEQALSAAGHRLVADSADGPDAAVVVVSDASEPAAVHLAWQQAEAVRRLGLPTIGATLTAASDLRGPSAALPHDGEWVELDGDGILSYTALLLALDGAAGDDGASSGRLVRLRRRVGAIAGSADKTENVPTGPALFISYSSGDRLAAEDVSAWLTDHGYRIWRDKDAIPGAANWRASIEDGIRESDMFVLLLSPKVTKRSTHVTAELQLAQSYEKRIFPVYLRNTSTLPAGSELILSPLQRIDLYPDFSAGMGRLIGSIGDAAVSRDSGGLRAKAKKASRAARRFARQREIVPKAAKYGGVAVAGAVVALAAATKAMSEQDEATRQREATRRVEERSSYIERTLQLLTKAMEEVQLAVGMSPEEYREEFRPNMMRILGNLESTVPDSQALMEWHTRLVENLEGVVREFDAAAARFERGDQSSYERSIKRLNSVWSETLESSVHWLQQALTDGTEAD